MRFVMMHKADKNSEAGLLPPSHVIVGMGELMGEMAKSGALLAGEGLQPSSKTVRLNFRSGKHTVTRGPFAQSNGLIAGFAVVRERSMEQAIEWSTRLANIMGDVEIDIGRVNEPWNLGLFPKPEGLVTERFLIMYKADSNSEAGVAPSTSVSKALRQLLDDMKKAGVLLAAEVLQPSAKGQRLNFTDEGSSTTDGPFSESKELIGGYCLMRAGSLEEAAAWAPRFAGVVAGLGDVEIDIRPVHEIADLG